MPLGKYTPAYIRDWVMLVLVGSFYQVAIPTILRLCHLPATWEVYLYTILLGFLCVYIAMLRDTRRKQADLIKDYNAELRKARKATDELQATWEDFKRTYKP